MAEEQKNSPTLKLNDLRLNEAIEVTLPNSRPVSTGTSRYGEWNLWIGNVKNAVAYEGRGKDEKKKEKYSGEVAFFPSAKLHEKMTELVGEEEGVTVKITKNAGENKRGIYTEYLIEKIGAGSPALSSKELELVNSVKELVSSGAVEEVTLEMFTNGAKEAPYNFDEKHAKELYNKYIKEDANVK